MLPARQRLAGLVVLLAAGWPPIHGYGLTVRRSNVFARQSPASSSLKPPTSRSSRRSWLGVVAAALVAAPGCGLAAAEDAAAAATTTAATEAPPTVQDLNARGYAQWTPTSPKNTPAAWKEQVAAGYTELLRLDRDWLVITKPRIEGDVPDGDAVRRVVGTVGTSSPLYGIRAVFRNIREVRPPSRALPSPCTQCGAFSSPTVRLSDPTRPPRTAHRAPPPPNPASTTRRTTIRRSTSSTSPRRRERSRASLPTSTSSRTAPSSPTPRAARAPRR